MKNFVPYDTITALRVFKFCICRHEVQSDKAAADVQFFDSVFYL